MRDQICPAGSDFAVVPVTGGSYLHPHGLSFTDRRFTLAVSLAR